MPNDGFSLRIAGLVFGLLISRASLGSSEELLRELTNFNLPQGCPVGTQVRDLKSSIYCYYEKNGKQIKHGFAISKHSNGTASWYREYQDGIEHGKSIWFYPSGKIKSGQRYVFGKLDGPSINFKESGELHVVVSYNQGKVNLKEGVSMKKELLGAFARNSTKSVQTKLLTASSTFVTQITCELPEEIAKKIDPRSGDIIKFDVALVAKDAAGPTVSVSVYDVNVTINNNRPVGSYSDLEFRLDKYATNFELDPNKVAEFMAKATPEKKQELEGWFSELKGQVAEREERQREYFKHVFEGLSAWRKLLGVIKSYRLWVSKGGQKDAEMEAAFDPTIPNKIDLDGNSFFANESALLVRKGEKLFAIKEIEMTSIASIKFPTRWILEAKGEEILNVKEIVLKNCRSLL